MYASSAVTDQFVCGEAPWRPRQPAALEKRTGAADQRRSAASGWRLESAGYMMLAPITVSSSAWTSSSHLAQVHWRSWIWRSGVRCWPVVGNKPMTFTSSRCAPAVPARGEAGGGVLCACSTQAPDQSRKQEGKLMVASYAVANALAA